MMIILLIVCLIVLGGIAGLLLYLSYLFGDGNAVELSDIFPPDSPKKILAIFPHPDDETMVAGILSKCGESKECKVILLCLTHGEKGTIENVLKLKEEGIISSTGQAKKTRGIPLGGKELAQKREEELKKAAQIMQVSRLEILDYPDGGLESTPRNQLLEVVVEAIRKYQPSVIITYDDLVGLYGHKDHIVTAQVAREGFKSANDKTVFPSQIEKGLNPHQPKRLYQVALPRRIIDWGIKRKLLAEEFEKVPVATGYVEVGRYAKKKTQCMKAHRTQRELLLGYHFLMKYMSGKVYFRLWHREFLYLAEESS